MMIRWSAVRWLALAGVVVAGCKEERKRQAPAATTPELQEVARAPGPPMPARATMPPATMKADRSKGLALDEGGAGSECAPFEPHQRAALATVSVVGDGLDVRDVVAPALCGALHTEATRRFAVGDGTLFKACLPDGLVVSISADVALTGPQRVTFEYADYMKKTALIELKREGQGTYNQRDAPTAKDSLTIAYDWHSAEAHVDLVWPSKQDRVVRIDAVFDCGGALR